MQAYDAARFDPPAPVVHPDRELARVACQRRAVVDVEHVAALGQPETYPDALAGRALGVEPADGRRKGGGERHDRSAPQIVSPLSICTWVEAGMLSASATLAVVATKPEFQSDLAAAREELAALRGAPAAPRPSGCEAEAALLAHYT